MSSSFFLVVLGFSLLLSWDCPPAESAKKTVAAAPDRATKVSAGEACSLASWSSTLELGLRDDAQAERQLETLRTRDWCPPEIRRLAEILLDDRDLWKEHHPERPKQVRVTKPDHRSLKDLKNDESGFARLELTIDAGGRVAQVVFLKRNANEKINALYLETARDWLFRPARDEAGYIESKMLFFFYFHRR